jgi:hypothetical protein
MPSTSFVRFAALSLALSFGLAVAQTVQTGSITITLDGVERTFTTSGTRIAENAAEGVTNEAARAFLERLAGTWIHTATYMILEPIVMGGQVLFAAPDMFVTIDAYAHDDPDRTDHLELRFGLDLETLLLSDETDIVVRYSPAGSSTVDSYLLTLGGIVVDGVARVDDETLSLQGSISGVLSRQLDPANEAHDPSDTISIEGRFDIQQLVGDARAVDLVTDAVD